MNITISSCSRLPSLMNLANISSIVNLLVGRYVVFSKLDMPYQCLMSNTLYSQKMDTFHTIGRCNNYAVLQSIPCSPECKIVGQILLDHPLSYALTATANVPIVYLQQFWRMVSKVPGPDFMNNVNQNKEAIQYPRFVKLIIVDLMKKFLDIPQRSEEDYHSIKDDIPLEMIERDAIAEATLLSLALHKTALATEAQENVSKVQKKLDEEEIEKMIEGEEYEESYASAFADFVFNDDVDDSGTKIEPGSHKEHPEYKEKEDVEIVKEKDIADDGTGSKEIRKEHKQTPIPSPTRSPRNVSSSDKIVSEELTATISPTTATTSKDSSITKCKKRSFSHMIKILPGSIAGMCRRRGQIRSHIKNKFITYEFFMSKIREVLDHCNKVLLETIFEKTNEMIRIEMPCLVNLSINKDRVVDPINAKEMIAKEFATHGPKMIEELFRRHMQNTTLNLYPKTSTSTAGKSFADLQHQLYLIMKSKPQDQAANPEI
ncbi:hypothetical protein Tco_0622240 [Tanacetum coccineum]